MKQFQDTIEGKNEVADFIETITHYVLTNSTPVDTDVENQKSRLAKLFCYIWYGHLYDSYGVCKRCQSIRKRKLRTQGFIEESLKNK